MRGLLGTSLICFGGLCASVDAGRAATVTLPAAATTLYLQGNIPSPLWVTFALDADIALEPSSGSDGPLSHYVLNITVSNAAGEAALQYAKIEGATVDNGYYPDGPPELLFSDTMRTLSVARSSILFNATLLSSTLTATLPDGLSFVPVEPAALYAFVAIEELTETPLPAAAPLFATGMGAIGLLAWRRRRTRGNT